MKYVSILLLILLLTACTPATQTKPELAAPTATAVSQPHFIRIDLPTNLYPRGVSDRWYAVSAPEGGTLTLIDSESGQRTLISENGGWGPVVLTQTTAAWIDDNRQVQQYNIASGETQQVTQTLAERFNLVGNDRWLVWQDKRNETGEENYYAADIYAYDLSTGEEIAVAVAEGVQQQPALANDTVVWADNRHSPVRGEPLEGCGNCPDNPFDIYSFNLHTRETAVLVADGKHNAQPTISGNRAAWITFGEGIKVMDLTTGEVETAVPYRQGLGQPQLFGDQLRYVVKQACDVVMVDESGQEIPAETGAFLFDLASRETAVLTGYKEPLVLHSRANVLIAEGCMAGFDAIYLLQDVYPQTEPERAAPTATSTAVPSHTDVANLLQNRPEPGETVEINAYFSGVSALPFPSPPPPEDQVACPTFTWSVALTDQPFIPVLQLLNGMGGNVLPDDAAWLIAAAPEAIEELGRDIPPQLPYHGRFRGRLADPAFAHCLHADRIFVVEETVAVYDEQPEKLSAHQLERPSDFSEWPRYDDQELGFSLAYPPDWAVKRLAETDVLDGLVLRPFPNPNHPVTIRVHEGETHLDQYDPASEPPLLRGVGMSVFEQGWSLSEWPDSQHLPGFVIDREAGPGEDTKAVLFSSNGRTYEIAFTYPTGFEASQELLTQFTALVESFRLDVPPAPSPTPPVKQALGEGPFISQEEAETAVRQHSGSEGEVEILAAQLMSEAAARRRADACATFTGHPDGVWVITVRDQFEGITRVMEQFLDATNSEVLCGEEIAPTPAPNITATPLPPGWPTPAPTPTQGQTFTSQEYGFTLQYPPEIQAEADAIVTSATLIAANNETIKQMKWTRITPMTRSLIQVFFASLPRPKLFSEK